METHGCTGISLFAVHHSSALTAEELLVEQPKAERVDMLDGIGLLVCVDTCTHTCAHATRHTDEDLYWYTIL
jgi:L-alanine-DL-glutamate epimerase-like enolase superfamily enzyme